MQTTQGAVSQISKGKRLHPEVQSDFDVRKNKAEGDDGDYRTCIVTE